MSAALPARPTTSLEQFPQPRRLWLLFAGIVLAALHAFWAVATLTGQFHVARDIYGGFRLLGSPTAGLTQWLVHVDFGVFLTGVLWLIRERWDSPHPRTMEPDSVAWSFGHRVGLAGVLALGAGLLLWNLGGPILWQDEAQSALISRTVVETGLPRGTDGLNYFSQEQGAEYAEHYLWRWHTWLPFYLVAGSYELMGESTFSARFPGALLGWLSIWLTYQVGVELWRDRRSALLGAATLSICVGFLLLSRQCRYYSASICFTLLSVLGYWRLMRAERWGSTLLIGGMTLLFQTHYVYTGICGAAFVAHCAWFRRERWKPLAVAAVSVVLLALPWVIWFVQMKYGSRYGGRTFHLMNSWDDLARFMQQIALELVPWMLWPIPFVVRHVRRKSASESDASPSPATEATALIGILVAAHMLLLAPIVPYAFFRYLAPIVPFTAMLVGRWIAEASRIHQALAGWMLAVVVLSWPCADFVKEQLRPVQAPVAAIVEYLQSHAAPRDVIAANYGDLPLKYYLSNRVIGGLTGEDLAQQPLPEWIVLRQYTCGGPLSVDDQLKTWAASGEYERITLAVPDVPFEHREDPAVHLFATDWGEKPVVIYHRN